MDFLPDKVIEKLIHAGAPVREQDGKKVIQLVEPQHIAVYMAYLNEEKRAPSGCVKEVFDHQFSWSKLC